MHKHDTQNLNLMHFKFLLFTEIKPLLEGLSWLLA